MYYVDLAVQGVVEGSMYALMALGLTLIYGFLRILHVAHATVFTLGAYLGVVVSNATGSLILGAVAALAGGSLAGIACLRLVYAPILDQPPLVPLIASVGLLIMMEDVFRLVFGNVGISFVANPFSALSISLGPLTVGVLQIAMVVAATATFSAFAVFTTFTRAGVTWRAALANPRMAESFGVDVARVRYVNFAFGSALAGAAGMLIALNNNFAEPGMGTVVSYKALAVIVLGGLGSMGGALVGSVLLGLAESYGTVFLEGVLDRDAIAALCLIAVLVLRPKGLGAGAGS